MKTRNISRRGFALASLQAAGWVAAEKLLRSSAGAAGLAQPSAGASHPKSGRMHVTLDPGGLSDRNLRFLKQIGVEQVELGLQEIPGYRPQFRLEADNLLAVKKRIESHGLQLESLYLDQTTLANFLLGRPEGERELDNVCHTIESMGRASVPIFLYSLLASRAIRTTTGKALPGYYRNPGGRGGAVLQAYDSDRAGTDEPMGSISVEETWDRITRFLRRCVPVAEAAKVTLACHPADPPLARYWGVNQAEYTMDAFKRFLDIAPSPRNGLLFCQGTIQEAGIDVLEYIRYFGSRGKLVHAELRGVRGTVPRYIETFMDDGDLDLWSVIEALKAVGYHGAVEIAHVPELEDDANSTVVNAWSVAYVKGMLAAAGG